MIIKSKNDIFLILKLKNKIIMSSTLLIQACREGDLEKVKYLCEAGADIRSDDDYSVRLASYYGHLEVVKYLCEAGADILSRDNWAVRYASYNCHYEVVKYLCEAGADIRSDDDFTVRWASENGHLEVVKYLCEAGADFRNNYAVRYASANGHLEVVEYLISLGADISKISENHKKYILLCEKMQTKIRERAQKKIYFWWIPICYDVNRGCGKRMMQKNLEKARELGLELN